jgi:hypothetical protein
MIARNWMAKPEYLATAFGNRQKRYCTDNPELTECFAVLTAKCRHGFPLYRVALSLLHFEYSLLAITPESDIEPLPPQAQIGQCHVRQPVRQRGINI